jgi:hypothetical protein
MENKFNGIINEQNGIYFVEFKNKRSKKVSAYIVNQNIAKLYLNKKCNFKAIFLIRPQSSGYDNLHVIRFDNIFNLTGSNGSIDKLEDLLKVNYIPSVVEIIVNK